jgi:hypothetical protein
MMAGVFGLLDQPDTPERTRLLCSAVIVEGALADQRARARVLKQLAQAAREAATKPRDLWAQIRALAARLSARS